MILDIYSTYGMLRIWAFEEVFKMGNYDAFPNRI